MSSSKESAVPKHLNLKLAKGTTPDRHRRFQIGEGEKTGSKVNSNKIHSDGKLMPVACQQCLGALARYDPAHVYGRGFQNFNEVFCCMNFIGLGNGGTQCGRCVGLGKGGECSPPPAAAITAAKAVIAAAPAYNRVLISNKKTIGTDLTPNEKDDIEKAVAASKVFNSTLGGLVKSGKVDSTPQKKRKHTEMMQGEALTDLHSKLARTQTGTDEKIETIQNAVKLMTELMQNQSKQLDEMKDRLGMIRARERHMIEGMHMLIDQGNSVAARLNFDRAADDNETPEVQTNVLIEFDPATADQDSDLEEVEDDSDA